MPAPIVRICSCAVWYEMNSNSPSLPLWSLRRLPMQLAVGCAFADAAKELYRSETPFLPCVGSSALVSRRALPSPATATPTSTLCTSGRLCDPPILSRQVAERSRSRPMTPKAINELKLLSGDSRLTPPLSGVWNWSRSEDRTHNCCPASRLGSIHANSTCPQDIYTASTRPGSLAAGATVLRGRASPVLPPRLPRFPRFPTPDCNRGNDIIAQPRHVPHVQDGAASGRAGRLACA